jgi:membrane protease YdiL (CAAX protease family)
MNDGEHRAAPDDRSRFRRFIEVTGFWLVYIGLGEALGLGPSQGEIGTYLLLGFPLVAVFQVLVARRDIRELWVRAAPKVVFRRLTIAIAMVVAIYPFIHLGKIIIDSEPASLAIAAAITATIGAGAAGYVFGLFRGETWRYLFLCILLAAGYGVLITVVFDGEKTLTHPLVVHPDQGLPILLTSFLLYIPTALVFEEVVFRGALDSHLHRAGERRGGWTAAYISLLWCLWHAPLFGWEFVNLLIAMFPMGIVLSIYWRKSGNLGVSGTAHALSDSIRNATVGFP